MSQKNILNPLRSLYRPLFITALAMYLPALIVSVFGDLLYTMYIGIAQALIFFTGVIFWAKGKQDIRGIQSILQGEILAHWTYDESHWKVYSGAEYQRQKENAYSTMFAFFIIGPLFGWSGYNGVTIQEGVIIGVVLGLYCFVLGMLFAKNVKKQSETIPFEAYISPTAAYINGMFIDWGSSGITLLGAAIANDHESGVRSLVIKYSVRERYGSQEKEMYLPVPENSMNEAESIMQRLHQQISR